MACFQEKRFPHKWIVRVRLNGKHVQKSFRTKEPAQREERKLLNQKDDYASRGYDPDIRLNSLFDDYERIHLPDLRAAGQQMNMLRYFRKEIGQEKVSYFTRTHIVAFRDTLIKKVHRGKVISKPTVNRYMATLSSVFQVAVERGKVSINPVRGIKKFPEPIPSTSFLEPEQFNKLYKVASDFLKPILNVLVGTGMRVGELINLEWHQISFARDSITFVRHKSDKTTGEKVISMAKIAKDTLLALKTPTSEGYVFTYRGKKLSNYGFLRGSIRRAGIHAGLGPIGFHLLRHTCASWLAMASGGDLALVKSQLGHTSMAVTERYAKLSREYQRKGVQGIDTYLNGH